MLKTRNIILDVNKFIFMVKIILLDIFKTFFYLQILQEKILQKEFINIKYCKRAREEEKNTK